MPIVFRNSNLLRGELSINYSRRARYSSGFISLPPFSFWETGVKIKMRRRVSYDLCGLGVGLKCEIPGMRKITVVEIGK